VVPKKAEHRVYLHQVLAAQRPCVTSHPYGFMCRATYPPRWQPGPRNEQQGNTEREWECGRGTPGLYRRDRALRAEATSKTFRFRIPIPILYSLCSSFPLDWVGRDKVGDLHTL
jgi:hypothetical protein